MAAQQSRPNMPAIIAASISSLRHSLAPQSEVAILSTCNRTEVYAVAERFHGAYADIRDFLCELGGLNPDELHPHLYSQHDDAAVSHLFSVSAGLESAVLGESEILGQVREAWRLAASTGKAYQVDHRIADLVSDLVRVPFGDGLRGEKVIGFHWRYLPPSAGQSPQV